jgi:hypothetical protein
MLPNRTKYRTVHSLQLMLMSLEENYSEPDTNHDQCMICGDMNSIILPQQQI